MDNKHLRNLISTITESAFSVNPHKVRSLFFMRKNRPYRRSEFLQDLAQLTLLSKVKITNEELDSIFDKFKFFGDFNPKGDELVKEILLCMVSACVPAVSEND